jgi:LuxR family maltose regulon positive regulatory protein
VSYLVEAIRASLGMADRAGAGALLRQAEDIVRHRPDLGSLVAEVAGLRSQLQSQPPDRGGAFTLTTAEIRVLRFLPTYLTMPEIAQRLYVSPNTIRTQVQAIYGKLGAVSRAEAVEHAIEAGLMEPLPMIWREE